MLTLALLLELISCLSWSKMGKQACCVLCPIPGDKTSEAFDRISQHTNSWAVAVGIWITGVFLWWHLWGSKDRLSDTTVLVTHLSLSLALFYPTVASPIALSWLDAGVDQGQSDEESRMAPSLFLLGSWQHLALCVQLTPENQHVLFSCI